MIRLLYMDIIPYKNIYLYLYMTTKIFMKLETPQSIAAKQNAAFQYFIKQNQQKQIYNSVGLNPRKDLTSSMIERVHLAKPGCGSCGK